MEANKTSKTRRNDPTPKRRPKGAMDGRRYISNTGGRELGASREKENPTRNLSKGSSNHPAALY
jgi:hypothetical protein